MMKDYTVIEAESLYELATKVKAFMNEGWETFGGVHSYPIHKLGSFGSSRMFCQAMGK